MKIDFNLKDIEPKKEQKQDKINSLLFKDKYARSLLFIVLRFSEKVKMVSYIDLEKFLKIDKVEAYRILEKFALMGLIKKIHVEGTKTIYFEPEYNDDEMMVAKFTERAKMTLGMK